MDFGISAHSSDLIFKGLLSPYLGYLFLFLFIYSIWVIATCEEFNCRGVDPFVVIFLTSPAFFIVLREFLKGSSAKKRILKIFIILIYSFLPIWCLAHLFRSVWLI